jgi:hypothetical protein
LTIAGQLYSTRVQRLAVLGLFVVLAVAHTWPLAARPGVHSRVDNGDYSLNVWAVDWVARTLPTDPAHLFDANIFHPARLTLAYSEPLVLQGALAIPAVWLGVPPVLTYNLLILAGLALSGWAFALLVHHDTGRWAAGIVAGCAVALNAHHLMRLVHLQALHLELLPLVFLALDRLLVTGRARYAALLGAAVAVQATASIYLLVFTGWAAACAWIARVPEWRHRLRDTAAWTALAIVVCALLLAPVLWPYWELSRTQGMVRGLAETQTCAATWTDYLFTGSRLHFGLWSDRYSGSSDANFPGLVVTALAIVGLTGASGRAPRARMWLAVVIGSVLLSALPRMPGFSWLHEHVPALGAIRCYSRAGQMALVGMAVLAGYGVARIFGARVWHAEGSAAIAKGGRWRLALAVALVAGINLEAVRAPLAYRDFAGIPSIYDLLRDEPQAAVIELPFYGSDGPFGNAGYMIYATRHRHPLVNGYSGFAPPGLEATAEAMRAFPGDAALDWMRTIGVTHIVVHHDTPQMQRRRALIDASSALHFVAERGGIAIYRLAR